MASVPGHGAHPGGPPVSRRWAPGAAAAAAYLAASAVLGASGLRVIPLFDGQAPPAPYRWVSPPDEFEDTNQAPAAGRSEYPLESDTPVLLNAFTDDGQAVLTGPEGVFAPAEGQGSVEITLTPVDPEDLGPPPGGLSFDGNAYRIEASYRPSGEPAAPAAPATLVLRYPVHATQLLRWDGAAWARVPEPTPLPAALQIFGEITELGTFVAAGPGQAGKGIGRWLAYGAAALAIAAVALYPVFRKRWSARRRAKERSGRSRGRPVRGRRGRPRKGGR